MNGKYLEKHIPSWMRLGLQLMDIYGYIVKSLIKILCPSFSADYPIPEPKRILVIPAQHIGDTLLATPAIRALRHHFPKAHITVLASPSGAVVLRGNPDIDEIRILNAPWHTRFELLPHSEPNSLKKWMRLMAYYRLCLNFVFAEGRKLQKLNFDIGIDLFGTVYNTLLMVSAKIPIRIGPNAVGIASLLTHPVSLSNPQKINEIDRAINIVQAIGAKPQGRKPFIICTEKDEVMIQEKLSKNGVSLQDTLIVAHPGCFSAPASRWRPKAWAKVLDTLIQECKVKIVLNGVPSERLEIESIKFQMKHKVIDLCGQLTIPELVALLKRCDLLLTVNSSPMHIASALGTPMIVIQGAWNVTRCRPYGDNHVLIVKNVPCIDCGLNICPKPVSCMDMITPEEVIAAAKEMLCRLGKCKQTKDNSSV